MINLVLKEKYMENNRTVSVSGFSVKYSIFDITAFFEKLLGISVFWTPVRHCPPLSNWDTFQILMISSAE